jgi:hypothetical protein
MEPMLILAVVVLVAALLLGTPLRWFFRRSLVTRRSSRRV